MSDGYTDRFGYPLSATETLARMNHPKRRGYYDKNGRWVKLQPKPPVATTPTKEPK